MNGIKWAMKNALDFKGRATRNEFWSYASYDIAFMGLVFCFEAIKLNRGDVAFYPQYAFPRITFFAFLITSIPRLSVIARRAHDMGSSCRLYFLFNIVFTPLLFIRALISHPLLMVFPLIPLLVPLYFLDGFSDGDNKYGPAPKGVPIRKREENKEEPPKVERTTASEEYNKMFANKNGQIDQLLNKMNKTNSSQNHTCKTCNTTLRPLEKFCSNCGTPIK